ncbi:MAG: Do family serine endopeptidase [Nitrospina sp.]|nr:Do family serine endopeptidase [Nitrospina sp.]
MSGMRIRPALTCSLFLVVVFISGAAASNLDNRRTPVVRAAQKAGPAVVNIFTEEAPRGNQNPFRNFFGDSFFKRFFGNVPNRRESARRSLGSGVIINPKGYILTNEHVIAQAVRIQVTLLDDREYEAQLIGADARSDLAVIKIDPEAPLPYVPMGRSDDLMIGETVIAIGNPFGLHHTVTQGIISALHRTVRANRQQVYSDFIQVDASINPGNSGGPLLNINGSLIGINTAIYQDAEGIGFAIPIDNARRIVNDLIEYGTVRRGWLGVTVQDITPDLARYFKLEKFAGVLITRLVPKGPASTGGLRQGDVITSIGDHQVINKSDYFQALSSYTIDDTVQLGIVRNGSRSSLRIRLAGIPPSYAREFAYQWLGIEVQQVSPAVQRNYRLFAEEGVVITKVLPNGPCGQVGIQPGDVIRRVNRDTIRTQEDYEKAVMEAGKLSSVVLLVQRGRSGYYVTLEP